MHHHNKPCHREDITPTPFSFVYSMFLAKITDDMFLELTREDTMKLLEELLLNALHWFEFPRQDINSFVTNEDNEQCFAVELTREEANIIATYMVVEWLSQQLASIENVRMKYSGTDFKFTSQANHIAKLQSLKDSYTTNGFHLQRLYKRRIKDKRTGRMKSTMNLIMTPLK